jgi:ribosomal protein S13
MPSEKKKKSKLKKLKNADKVKVKAEPLDIKPLSSFIGDRVELIRQTFMCLKPKTVKQIAPDFLQGKSIDKIQEYCLDEVLGISKKRLTAIINNTKCPTDTESSDSDNSDIQKVDGHISLEEISSDSNDGVQKKLTKKASKNVPSKFILNYYQVVINVGGLKCVRCFLIQQFTGVITAVYQIANSEITFFLHILNPISCQLVSWIRTFLVRRLIVKNRLYVLPQKQVFSCITIRCYCYYWTVGTKL